MSLDRQLLQAAACVQAVRQGRSLSDALAAVAPEWRPGVQALSFHTLRHLGGAQMAREVLAARKPTEAIEGLLLVALSLLWPQPAGSEPLYDSHTVVDQAVHAARRESEGATRFVNAVLRRFLREREALVPAWQASRPEVAHHHPRWWISQLQRDWPQAWAELLAANQAHPPMDLRVNLRQVSAAAYLEELAAAGIAATLRPLVSRVPPESASGDDSAWPATLAPHEAVLRLARPVPV
ncbi:MAG: hypothetical protein RL722_115, partial [Pseudomonadota bacterium]